MRDAVFTQVVARPQDVVWTFLSDLRNDAAWRGEIVKVELVSGEPGTAPTTYRETVEWEGLRGESRLTVAEADSPSRIVVVAEDGSYHSRSEWTLQPCDDGCHVTLHFSLETLGAMHVVEPFMWGIVSRWLERDLPQLETHIA